MSRGRHLGLPSLRCFFFWDLRFAHPSLSIVMAPARSLFGSVRAVRLDPFFACTSRCAGLHRNLLLCACRRGFFYGLPDLPALFAFSDPYFYVVYSGSRSWLPASSVFEYFTDFAPSRIACLFAGVFRKCPLLRTPCVSVINLVFCSVLCIGYLICYI